MGIAIDLGGTIRESAAKETLARRRPLLPKFGITRLANITGLDTIGIPVWTVVRPLGRSLSVSQGKGVTTELALLSGIMENIEVFHAEQRQPQAAAHPLFACEHDASFVAPHRLAIRSDAKASKDRSISWMKGSDLLGGGEKWIPAELVDLDFAKRRADPIFLATSNGLASGNTRTEAIVHGLCEVIERDQTSFWFAEQDEPRSRTNRRVVVESINDPVCRPLVQKCLAAELQVFIWYLAINIDIPVFACTIADPSSQTLYPQQTTGYGCHPVATVALARAIAEAAQSRVTHISGLREDLTWARYRDEFLCETAADQSALHRMSEEPETLDFAALPSCAPATARDTSSLLEEVLQRLRAVGLKNAIAVDLAEREFFSVVYTCVPDLEYRTPKARSLYVPGERMGEYLKRPSNGRG